MPRCCYDFAGTQGLEDEAPESLDAFPRGWAMEMPQPLEPQASSYIAWYLQDRVPGAVSPMLLRNQLNQEACESSDLHTIRSQTEKSATMFPRFLPADDRTFLALHAILQFKAAKHSKVQTDCADKHESDWIHLVAYRDR